MGAPVEERRQNWISLSAALHPFCLPVDARAAIVVRVGETFVERSASFHATAVALNGAGVASPGGSTWSPQTVKNVLIHPLYRGEYRHGAMRTVARGGTLVRVRSPEAEVLRIAHPELRIWPATCPTS